MALTEQPIPVEFDPATLDTVGVLSYTDRVGGPLTTTHPLTDPGTGDLINVVLAFGRSSEYRVTRQRGTLHREVIATVTSDRPGYLHSFAVTERHVVIVVHPLVVNPLSLVLRGRPFIDIFRWDPAVGTRIVVIDTATGVIRADTTTAACFAFHHINAFDRSDTSEVVGDAVVLDLSVYADASIVDAFRLDRLRAGHTIPVPRPTRFTIALDTGHVRSRQLSVAPLELPRVAVPAGREHRFVFGCGAADGAGNNFLDQLVRVDCATGATLTWNEPGTYPGEPVVVARPTEAGGTGAEDDGVVLSVVLDATAGASFLLVLDAATLTEPARDGAARHPVRLPRRIHRGGQSMTGRSGSPGSAAAVAVTCVALFTDVLVCAPPRAAPSRSGTGPSRLRCCCRLRARPRRGGHLRRWARCSATAPNVRSRHPTCSQPASPMRRASSAGRNHAQTDSAR